MFNMSEFIEENLKEGYLTRAFTETQINIFALNYLNRGQIDQEVFDKITKFVEDNEPYPEETEETEENVEPPKETEETEENKETKGKKETKEDKETKE